MPQKSKAARMRAVKAEARPAPRQSTLFPQVFADFLFFNPLHAWAQGGKDKAAPKAGKTAAPAQKKAEPKAKKTISKKAKPAKPPAKKAKLKKAKAARPVAKKPVRKNKKKNARKK